MEQDSQEREVEKMFIRFVKEVIKDSEKLFSSEESNGKYLDLNSHY